MNSQYIFDYEGEEDEDMENFETLLVQLQLEDDDEIPETSQFVTSYGEIDGYKAITQLNDQAANHALIAPSKSTYVLKNRYDSTNFQGIMIDTGAAQWSTAGKPQLLALQRLYNVNFNESMRVK